jgi:acyl-CoA thioester hydrolase
MTTKQIFEYQKIVHRQDLDSLQHVNNVVYVQWIQEASGKHWFVLTKNHPELPYFWVVYRHEIDYLGQAKLGDTLLIKTWVGKTGGVKSVRHVEIFKNDKVIVKAATIWILMSRESGKPAKIDTRIMEILFPDK